MEDKNEFIKKHCLVSGNPESKNYLIFEHGFNSSKEAVALMSYRFSNDYFVVQCDARGHGSQKNIGKREDWVQSMDDTLDLVKEFKKQNKNVSVIGHSMGGFKALSEYLKSNDIDNVFVVAGGNGLTIMDEPHEQDFYENRYHWKFDRNKYNLDRKKGKLIIPDEIKNLVKAFPENYKNTDKKKGKHIFLIHSKHDPLVPYEQFLINKKEFNVPDENTLVYNDLVFNHVEPFYKRKTIKFIKRKLKGN